MGWIKERILAEKRKFENTKIDWAEMAETKIKLRLKEIIAEEIKFLEEWLDTYSEGEGRLLVSEEDISNRIKYLKTLLK
jgi:hypothetical protein